MRREEFRVRLRRAGARLALAALAAALPAALLCVRGAIRLDRGDWKWRWLTSDQPLYYVEAVLGGRRAIPAEGILQRDSSHPRSFSVAKSSGTYRIFCVGQSTTEGLPFAPRGGYPEWLGAYLRDLLPGVKTEVINAGAAGSTSGKDLVIVKEVLRFDPDLLVLYEGNNEGYHFVFKILGKWPAEAIAAVADSRRISVWPLPIHSAWLKTIISRMLWERFKDNVTRMASLARGEGARVLLPGQVNRPLLKTGRMDRASRILKDIAASMSPGVAFVDAPGAFLAARSRRPARWLLVDGIHPTLYGQELIALSICRELQKHGWIAPAERWQWRRLRSEKRYREILGLSNEFVAAAYSSEAESLKRNSRNQGVFERLALRRDLEEAKRLRLMTKSPRPRLKIYGVLDLGKGAP